VSKPTRASKTQKGAPKAKVSHTIQTARPVAIEGVTGRSVAVGSHEVVLQLRLRVSLEIG
jgi:hypothetical protein